MIPRKQQTLQEKIHCSAIRKTTGNYPALGLSLTIILPPQEVLVINMTEAHRPALALCLEWGSLTQISFDISIYLAWNLNF